MGSLVNRIIHVIDTIRICYSKHVSRALQSEFLYPSSSSREEIVPTPVAYFELHRPPRGLKDRLVYDIICRVMDRMRSSRIIVGVAVLDQGRYVLAFYNRSAADLFEQAHRNEGRNPRRSRIPIAPKVTLEFEDISRTNMLTSLSEFRTFLDSGYAFNLS